jgi:CRISPR/Cas system-associated protein Csx1
MSRVNLQNARLPVVDRIIYFGKIANATQVNAIPINTKTKQLKSMTLCNIHSASATVTVFLSNSTDNWYIIKDVVIPVGATLKLESDELDYDGDIFNLYVKLGGTTPVDVIIR